MLVNQPQAQAFSLESAEGQLFSRMLAAIQWCTEKTAWMDGRALAAQLESQSLGRARTQQSQHQPCVLWVVGTPQPPCLPQQDSKSAAQQILEELQAAGITFAQPIGAVSLRVFFTPTFQQILQDLAAKRQAWGELQQMAQCLKLAGLGQ